MGGAFDALDALALELGDEEEESTASAPEPNAGRGDAEIQQMNLQAPLLDLIREDTGERGTQGDGYLKFEHCPVCGHNGDFCYYETTNTWCCFGGSNTTPKAGGGYSDYLIAAKGYADAEAIAELREVTGNPYPGKTHKLAKKGGTELSPAFALDARGAVKRGLENHVLAIEQTQELKGRFRYNKLARMTEAILPLPWDGGTETRRVSKADEIELRIFLDRLYDLGSKPHTEDALTAIANRNAYDPVDEWLNSMAWDGEPHAGRLASKYLGCPPSDYVYEIERLIISAMIVRTYKPGAKFDCMPILVGGQGLGKSTYARLLAGRDEWFTDGVMGIGGKEALEIIQGKTLAEFAELDALKGKAAETTKRFITSIDDTYRAAYGKEAETHPRRCVFIGTTNNEHFLSDMTGNRRFFPIRCGAIDRRAGFPSDEAAYDFAQAWAEMYATYRKEGGLSLRPSDGLLSEAATQCETFAYEDPRIGMIGAYLEKSRGERVCAVEIVEYALDEDKSKKWLIAEVHEIMAHHFPHWRRMEKRQRTQEYGLQTVYVREKPCE